MIPFIAKVNSPQEQTSNSTTSTQSTETADWQTYTNNQYGFEMKYPAEWGNPKELADHELMFGDSFGVISQVYYGNNHQVLTIDDLAATKNSGYNKGDIIIDDIKGFEISSSQIGTVIYVPTSGQNIFTIEYDSPIHDQLLDEVLSTFKFISPTSQITSNEITIMTYGVRFITDNILVATEYVNGVSTSKEWTVNYKDAKYYEEYGQVLNGVVTWLQRPGDFGDWIQTRKLVSAPEYNGPGIPGVIKIVGTVDKDSTLQASKIIQHVQ